MDSEDTDSDEEVNDLLREAANCDYVNNLYNNTYEEKAKSAKTNKNHKGEEQDQSDLTSHQVFLSKALSKKLDTLIDVITVPHPNNSFNQEDKVTGIKLFQDSVLIDTPEAEILPESYKPKRKLTSEKELELRAKEAAVDPEWVVSKSNTAAWRFYKSKIIYAKADSLTENKLECTIVSKTF